MVGKKIKTGQMVARIAALGGLLQGGCMALPHTEVAAPETVAIQQTVKPELKLKDMMPNEKQEVRAFMDEYARTSPAARQVLKDLMDLGITIEFFEKDVDGESVFSAGESDGEVLRLNRLMREKGVPFDDTFFHEAEHILHLSAARRFGINGASFRSLDDVYIYGTIMEALAYRKAALCCAEHQLGPDRLGQAKEQADAVFADRMKTDNKALGERQVYERAALDRATFETNALPNQVRFKGEPDWNKVVSVMSRGEVTKISDLPKPTLSFLHLCILNALEKNPNVKNLKEMDLSCVLKHQSLLRQDEMAIKKSISNILMATYDSCCQMEPELSDETIHSFLYLMGWPTKEQMEAIDAETMTFDEAREKNLEAFSLNELFDGAEQLIQNPDVQEYRTEETQNYGKMLRLEKQILCPAKKQSVRSKEIDR